MSVSRISREPSSTAAPSGPAGGDLAGTFPNPSVAVIKNALGTIAQAAWYVDPVGGSDTNDGATPATALATLTELARRFFGQSIAIPVVVHILSDVPNTDAPIVTFNVIPGGSVVVQGTPTTIRTSTWTGVTNLARATNTPYAAADATFPVGYGATYIARGVRFRMTNGPAAGAVAWALKDLGGNNLRMSSWMVPNQAIGTPSLVLSPAPVVGNGYVVEQLTKLNGRVTFEAVSDYDFTFIPRVRFVDLEFVDRVTIDTRCEPTTDIVSCYGCDVGSCCASGDGVSYIASRCGAAQVIAIGSPCMFYACAILGGMTVFDTVLAMDFACVVQSSRVRVYGVAACFIGDLGLFDSTSDGLIFYGGYGKVFQPWYQAANYLWGSGAAAYGVRVSGGVCVSAASFANFTIAGTTNATIIGTTAKAAAALPFVDQDFAGASSKFAGLVLA